MYSIPLSVPKDAQYFKNLIPNKIEKRERNKKINQTKIERECYLNIQSEQRQSEDSQSMRLMRSVSSPLTITFI